MGDYKVSLEKAEKQVSELEEKYPDLSVEVKNEEIILSLKDGDDEPKIQEIQQIEVPPHISYIFLKYKLIMARINKAISKNPEAHDIVNQIILYVKKCMTGQPSKFWLIAVKAVQI